MADSDSWDAENFELDEPAKKPAVLQDKWEGEDEDDDVKDNWDDEEEDKGQEKPEAKLSQKKKIEEKNKEKEIKLKKQQEELRKRLKEAEQARELTPEEESAERLRQKQAQEESDLELAREAFGVTAPTPRPARGVDSSSSKNSAVSGIDSLNPSSREDFDTLEKLLTEKITQFDKSIHYSTFLESLFRELCISLEVEDLKKINSSLTVLLNEKQKAEKAAAKGKKGKKGKTNLAGGGLKMKMRDDLDDYGGGGGGGGGGGYEQDYEDFM